MKDKMARTKLTARKSTGGKVPRKQQVKEMVQRPKNVTQPLALITKKIRKIRTYSDILYIAKRIFQKDPSVSKTYYLFSIHKEVFIYRICSIKLIY